MATVNDVKFFPQSEGRCPRCGRDGVALGRVNVAGLGPGPRCIDCYFGPPRRFWVNCPACGFFQPEGETCDRCSKPLSDPKENRPDAGN
jgi:hypothetical protein